MLKYNQCIIYNDLLYLEWAELWIQWLDVGLLHLRAIDIIMEINVYGIFCISIVTLEK